MSFRRWLIHPVKSITGAATVIAAASFFSRLLGVFRDRILASQFGAGADLDVYYAAFRVPDMIYNLLIVGALSAGFIPVFVATRQRLISGDKSRTFPPRGNLPALSTDRQAAGRDQEGYLELGKVRDKEAWHLVNAFMTTTFVSLVAICGLGIAFVDKIVPLVTPGFSPEKIFAVINLSRIMFLSPLLLGISAVVGGVLQSYRNFFVFSLAPIFYNVGIILGAIVLVPLIGLNGLAWGVVMGAALHLAVQLPTATKLGWSIGWVWDLKNKGLRMIWRLMLPRTLSLGVTQLNLLILTVAASYLTSGSVAIFNLATNLFMLPVGTIGIAYALAVFPTLSELARSDDTIGFRDSLRQTIQHVLFFIVPSTVLILLLRAQIVRFVLGSGAFDWDDTVMTFETLRFLAYSLFAQALIPILARAFYAYKNTATPLWAGLLGDGLTIFFSLILMGHYGVTGLAMAFSIGSIVQVVSLWIAMRWRIGDLGELKILIALKSFTIAGLVMAFVIQGVKTGVGVLFGTTTFFDIVLQGGLAGLAGIITYLSVLSLLQSEELDEFWAAWRWKAAVVELSKEGLDEGEGI